MEGFIDIHCHILPGVDDGAKNMEQTREMLRIACTEGVREIITTPHFFASHKNASMEILHRTIADVEEKMKEWEIPIKLYSGSELYYRSEIPELLEAGEAGTLAGGHYCLVEFDPMVEYSYLRNGILKLVSFGFIPILAHAERYECLFQKKERLQRIKDHGGYIQVNASSFLGGFMSEMTKRAKYMLKKELVDFVGTDAHSNGNRSPKIKECAAYLYKKLGKEKAERILYENPRAVIEDRSL